jgi:hypothetical protein
MNTRTRFFAGALAAMFMGGVAAAPMAAHASEEGRRNTTLGLGAATAYLFTRGGSKLPAFAGAAATAYAYKRYDDKIKARKKREKYQYGSSRYRSGYAAGKRTSTRAYRSRR